MGRAKIPPAPLALGLAGLLPFWGLAIGIVLHPPSLGPSAALGHALAVYGAIILSFLGGIRWGLAVTQDEDWRAYAVSVVPSLIAWALLLAPQSWHLLGLGAVVILWGPFDLGLIRAGKAPDWFGGLRLILSTGAGAALLLAGFAAR